MSDRSGDSINLTALDQWLRRWDLAASVEVIPAADFSQLAVIRGMGEPSQASLWVGPGEDQVLSPLVAVQAVMPPARSDVSTTIARPRWSADGQWIAFATYEGPPPGKEHQLWVVKAEAGSLPELLYQGNGIIAAHRWSPGGACLAVADSAAGLTIVWLDGTSEVVDPEAMRYPLEENAVAWVDDGQRLVYGNPSPDEAGLWSLTFPERDRHQVVALAQGEIMIPADVNVKSQVAWGALRGNALQHKRDVALYLWPSDGGKMKAIPLPNVEFDPASGLLPNDDGSLWAFTVWKEGRRVPFVVDRVAHRGRVLAVPGTVTHVLGWSGTPPRLWALLHPPQLVDLDIDQPAGLIVSTDGSFSLDLTPAELLYLLETLGGHRMIGLNNPLSGMAKDEAGRLKKQAKAGLISKGYVVALPGDRAQIDLTIAALVQCCASPQQTWTTTYEGAAGERDVRHVHRAQDLTVEDAILPSGTHRLTPLRDDAAVLQRIGQQMRLKGQPAAPGQPFALPEEILFRTREVAAALGEETAVRYLVSAGATETTAAHFAQALAQPMSNSSASRWSVADEKATATTEQGIGILEGTSGLWLLQPCAAGDAVQMRISPADATTVLQHIARLFTRQATPSPT